MEEKKEREDKIIDGYIIKELIYEVPVTWSNYDTTPQPCNKSFKGEGIRKELKGYIIQCHLLQSTDLQ